MASGNESTVLSRKTIIVSALCARLSLDPKVFLANTESDLKSLCISILKSSPKYASLEDNTELMKWIEFADSFSVKPETCISALEKINEDLIQKSVLLGGGLQPSEADTIVYLAILSSLITLPDSDKLKLPHLMRWADYIQEWSMEDVVKQLEKVSIKKAPFDPPVIAPVAKVEKESNSKKGVQGTKEKKVATGNEAAAEKKQQEKAGDEKDKEVCVSLLRIQIGLIRKAYKHPSADSLLIEEIDVGEAKVRQVVSGLAKYFSPEDLTNRLVALITNVKPGKLRDVVSEGLVLCASNEDHSVVEPLTVPEGAKIGECVTFSGHDGKPEDVLNPKKKHLDKITPNLFTDENGVATFKGIPFMTSGGPCSSSIPKATIK
jgi:aminoacyl tRNA synthase complex-interacting multifunctional protein 1